MVMAVVLERILVDVGLVCCIGPVISAFVLIICEAICVWGEGPL